MIIAMTLVSALVTTVDRTYPGAAPCDTTLQACIDAADSGATIAIANSDRIDQAITISKSLTLTRANATITPTIGSANATMPRQVTVETSIGATQPVVVTFSFIRFDGVQLKVNFRYGAGHRFRMSDCELRQALANNNETGVYLEAQVPARFELQKNRLTSNGQVVAVRTRLTADADVLIAENILNGTSDTDSSAGIEVFTLEDSKLAITIENNIIHAVAGCSCGGAAALDLRTQNQSNVNVRFIGNTIDDIRGNGTGITAMIPAATSQLVLGVYNNTFTRAGMALYLPASAQLTLNSSNNNFHGLSAPSELGGRSLGSGTLGVDPMFSDSATQNYRLAIGSALIGAGRLDVPNGLPSVDYRQSARVVGQSVDIGAFEMAADLSAALTRDTPVGGASTRLDLTVTNNGPDRTQGTATFTIPDGLSVEGFSAGCTGGPVITCELGQLDLNGQVAFNVTVRPGKAPAYPIAYAVTSVIPDPDSNNDRGTLDLLVPSVASVPRRRSSGCGCGATTGAGALWMMAWVPFAWPRSGRRRASRLN